MIKDVIGKVIGKVIEDVEEFVKQYDATTSKVKIYLDTLLEFSEQIDEEEVTEEVGCLTVANVSVDEAYFITEFGDRILVIELNLYDLERELEIQRKRERRENQRIEDEYKRSVM